MRILERFELKIGARLKETLHHAHVLCFEDRASTVDELAAEYDCFYSLDLYTPGMKMLETKKYLDVTGNGINHPNDFWARLYANTLFETLVGYENLN